MKKSFYIISAKKNILLSLRGRVKFVSLLALLFVVGVLPSFAESSLVSDIQKIAEVALKAAKKMELDLYIDGFENEEFCKRADYYLQLTAKIWQFAEIDREDYFNLALYLLAIHFKEYKVAKEVLEHELKQAHSHSLKNWIASRLTAVSNNDCLLSIDDEADSLKLLFSGHN